MNIARIGWFYFVAGSLLASFEAGLAADFTVQMTDSFSFDPASLSIAQGDSVTWVNGSYYYYTHTSTSGSNAPAANGLWNSGDVSAGGSFTLSSIDSKYLNPGDYPYFCGYHYYYGMLGTLMVSAANVPPSVNLTNPAAGTTFRAPANITLMADANDTDGSVTNVEFFSGASSLGSVATVPFNLTVNNVPAGNYTFTAVATDDQGTPTTSAGVNVIVLTNAILTAPVRTNGQFHFTILGIAGQTYATEVSTDLTNWSSLSTNTAPTDSFEVVDPSATNNRVRFYRARQDF